MGTVHGIGCQIQCSMQIHWFKKHSVRHKFRFKKYLNCIALAVMDEPE